MSIKMRFRDFVKQKYRRIFSNEGWDPIVAGILIGLINIVSYVWVKKPFTVYTGFLNWGQHIYGLVGLKDLVGTPKLTPLLEPTSVGDIGAIIGAMLVASLSNEFTIRGINSRIEVFESIAGGVLMALGVSLAFGCNWGGFISAITSWSLHGFAFLMGAFAGGYIGFRYVNWKAEKLAQLELLELAPSITTVRKSYKGGVKLHTSLALAILALLIVYYAIIRDAMVGGLFIGIAVGAVIQRTRLCFATAFRDLFNGPENARALNIHKGIAIAILTGSIGVFALKYMGMAEKGIGVSPVYITNVIGGMIFTFGSILAGGCASGLLWRTGEGHAKAWIALLSTVLTYPIFFKTLRPYLSSYPKIFIPSIGWAQAFTFMFIFIMLYIVFIYYLEYKYRIEYRTR
jgi:uncharacterized membrane protein YedE/YeeE